MKWRVYAVRNVAPCPPQIVQLTLKLFALWKYDCYSARLAVFKLCASLRRSCGGHFCASSSNCGFPQRVGIAGAGADGEETVGETTSQDGDVLVSGGAPFETHLWRARLAIQRATNAMLAAYEVRTLILNISVHGGSCFRVLLNQSRGT